MVEAASRRKSRRVLSRYLSGTHASVGVSSDGGTTKTFLTKKKRYAGKSLRARRSDHSSSQRHEVQSHTERAERNRSCDGGACKEGGRGATHLSCDWTSKRRRTFDRGRQQARWCSSGSSRRYTSPTSFCRRIDSHGFGLRYAQRCNPHHPIVHPNLGSMVLNKKK